MRQKHPPNQEQIASLQKEIQPLTEGFDVIVDHVVVTDAEGRIIYANKGAEQHTGFSVAEMMGKAPGKLWGGMMDNEFYEKMWKTIKHFKSPYVGEVQNHQKDGTTYWQELRIFPVLDGGGEVKFFIGMEPDITIRKIFEGHKQQYM